MDEEERWRGGEKVEERRSRVPAVLPEDADPGLVLLQEVVHQGEQVLHLGGWWRRRWWRGERGGERGGGGEVEVVKEEVAPSDPC